MRLTSILLTASAIAALTACATQDTNPYYKVSSKYPHGTSQQGQSGATQYTGHEAPVSYASSNAQGYNGQAENGYSNTQGSTHYASSNQGYVSTHHASHTAAPSYLAQQGYSNEDILNAKSAQAVQAAHNVRTGQTTYPAQVQTQTIYAAQAQPMIETGGQNAGAYGQNMATSQVYTQTVQHTPQATPQVTPQYLYEATPQIDTASYLETAPSYPVSAQGYNTPIATNGIAYIVQEKDTVYSLSRRTCSSISQIQQINGLTSTFLIRAGETIRLPASSC